MASQSGEVHLMWLSTGRVIDTRDTYNGISSQDEESSNAQSFTLKKLSTNLFKLTAVPESERKWFGFKSGCQVEDLWDAYFEKEEEMKFKMNTTNTAEELANISRIYLCKTLTDANGRPTKDIALAKVKPLDGMKAQFKSMSIDKFLCPKNGGGTLVAANCSEASNKETHVKIWAIPGTNKYLFQASKEQFYLGLDGDLLVAISKKPGIHEAFEIVHEHDDCTHVRIKAWNGGFLQAKEDKEDWVKATTDSSDRSSMVFSLNIVGIHKPDGEIRAAIDGAKEFGSLTRYVIPPTFHVDESSVWPELKSQNERKKISWCYQSGGITVAIKNSWVASNLETVEIHATPRTDEILLRVSGGLFKPLGCESLKALSRELGITVASDAFTSDQIDKPTGNFLKKLSDACDARESTVVVETWSKLWAEWKPFVFLLSIVGHVKPVTVTPDANLNGYIIQVKSGTQDDPLEKATLELGEHKNNYKIRASSTNNKWLVNGDFEIDFKDGDYTQIRMKLSNGEFLKVQGSEWFKVDATERVVQITIKPSMIAKLISTGQNYLRNIISIYQENRYLINYLLFVILFFIIAVVTLLLLRSIAAPDSSLPSNLNGYEIELKSAYQSDAWGYKTIKFWAIVGTSKYWLQASSRQYIGLHGENLVENLDKSNKREEFEIVQRHGNSTHIRIKASNGKFVQLEEGKWVTLTATNDWEEAGESSFLLVGRISAPKLSSKIVFFSKWAISFAHKHSKTIFAFGRTIFMSALKPSSKIFFPLKRAIMYLKVLIIIPTPPPQFPSNLDAYEVTLNSTYQSHASGSVTMQFWAIFGTNRYMLRASSGLFMGLEGEELLQISDNLRIPEAFEIELKGGDSSYMYIRSQSSDGKFLQLVEGNRMIVGPTTNGTTRGKEDPSILVVSTFSVVEESSEIIQIKKKAAKYWQPTLSPKPVLPNAPCVLMLGPWGGSGGQEWNMENIDASTSLKEIEISYGEVIHSISFKYVNKGNLYQCTKGGDGGPESKLHTITLDDDEFVASISGHYSASIEGEVISSLTFVTTWLQHGPYGKQAGTPFSISVPNGKLIGFFGRAGQYLNKIGFYGVPN